MQEFLITSDVYHFGVEAADEPDCERSVCGAVGILMMTDPAPVNCPDCIKICNHAMVGMPRCWFPMTETPIGLCPHVAVPGTDRCLFHTDTKEN